ARWGVGARQSVVARGEPVSEGQKLLHICDLKRFTINTRVHEALISRVHVGQPAAVRLDIRPDRLLQGRVQSVANVAAPETFLSADVKVFPVQVELTQTLPGLRPGISGEVRITVGERRQGLAVPLEAVVRSGRETFCFVKSDKGVEERA